uniref:DNA damage-regulated autophagy modulator protein 2 n=1 Tax=Phallusia mammillata TaxID=59560 RepID=A0A6F9DAS4_9ASCI|nr:DNA damage-regulated autophagy modulator protein 2 [Phallusia mammillata]
MGPFWFQRGLAFLPVFLVVWTYLTFTISYIIAVSRGDVDPGFPYISDTGARRPESSIFGQMLNISAVAALACLYVRYKQVTGYTEMLDMEKTRIVTILNKVSMAMGVLICLGLSLVANFQETSVLGVHICGALMAFVLGTIYAFIQSYITYKMHPEVNSRHIFHARLIIACLCAAAMIGGVIATSFVPAIDEKGNMKLHWKPGEKGYAAHLASTIFEWILAGGFLSFFYTFIRDFQVISIHAETHLHNNTLYHRQGEEIHEEEQEGDQLA